MEILAGDCSGALLGRSGDLSIGGACIATQSPFSFKSLHRVVLRRPGQDLSRDAAGCGQREDPVEHLAPTGVAFETPAREHLELIGNQVLAAGRKLARFLDERTALRDLGLEEAMGLAQVTGMRTWQSGDPIDRQGNGDSTACGA